MDILLGSVARKLIRHVRSKPIEHEDLSIPDSKIENVNWSKILNKPSEYNPTRHAERHGPGGDDLIMLDASQIVSGHLLLDRLPPAPGPYMVLGVCTDTNKVQWVKVYTAHHGEQAYIPFYPVTSKDYDLPRRLWFRSDLNMFTFQDQNNKKWRFGLVGGKYTADLSALRAVEVQDIDRDGSITYDPSTKQVTVSDGGGDNETLALLYYPINATLEAPIPNITVYADFTVDQIMNMSATATLGITVVREDDLKESVYIAFNSAYLNWYGNSDNPEGISRHIKVEQYELLSEGSQYVKAFTYTPTSRIKEVVAVWFGFGIKGGTMQLTLNDLGVEAVGWNLKVE